MPGHGQSFTGTISRERSDEVIFVMQGLARMAGEQSVKAYFRGNGANCLKNVPETALKLTLNDRVKSLVLRDGHPIALCELPCAWHLTSL